MLVMLNESGIVLLLHVRVPVCVSVCSLVKGCNLEGMVNLSTSSTVIKF